MHWNERNSARILLCCATLWMQALTSASQEQYPKPLTHTPTDHPAARVILINIDGMHALDLANWVANHPRSALAELSSRGVTYTNAHVPWADPAAGLVALATGGTPVSTGIISSNGYDHALSPAGSHCRTKGAPIILDGTLGRSNDLSADLDTTRLPLDPFHGCVPVFPHNLLRVNNIFEVIKATGGRTAWAGDSATLTDLYEGPSGNGLDEACGFEQSESKGSVATSLANDDRRINILLRWIDGRDCAGSKKAPIPELFGMSFTSVGAAQAAKDMGYRDVTGTPSAGLEKSLAFTDAAIGRIIEKLKERHLYDSTWIIVTSAYGQAPMNPQKRRIIADTQLTAVANSVRAGLVAHMSTGGIGMIWLSDSSMVETLVSKFGEQAAALGIEEIYSGTKIGLTLNLPEHDTRMPDIILQPELGVIWSSPNDAALASHGGMQDENTHVALLVSGSQLTGRCDKTWVPTSQVAPLILRALGMEKFDLQALHREHTPALPGIF